MPTSKGNVIQVYWEIQSPRFLPMVMDRVAAAMPQAKMRTCVGAGHVPI